MSTVIETFLLCDGDNGRCGRTFGVDNRNANATQHRKDAKINGWTYSGGLDYCDQCKKRKPKQNSEPNPERSVATEVKSGNKKLSTKLVTKKLRI